MKMKIRIIILSLVSALACGAQTNVIFGLLSDVSGATTANVSVVLTLISPQP